VFANLVDLDPRYGHRNDPPSFADVAATLADFFGVRASSAGTGFLAEIRA